ncbi:hypothetical protein BHE90_009548 [Fusarium euwallaceae]|uniref:Uncharacterized protein n=3 Tax=Fusarium solani species complex TaxID=232080 RepID=A0A3M2SGU5_9HYPO|nr:hypothetical protein CDV36_003979 [Fusarium kuroshium]RSL94697.1 hypothetical protein CEP52_012508 [Fusarium oligoseptatum]RTE75997.1 hypothetical protein BHE90_009548 [Fusarium euwallaceae]
MNGPGPFATTSCITCLAQRLFIGQSTMHSTRGSYPLRTDITIPGTSVSPNAPRTRRLFAIQIMHLQAGYLIPDISQ